MTEKFAYFNQLLLIYLKRDWKKILFWIVLLGSFGGAFVPAFSEITKDGGLIGMFYTMDNPALTAMVGTSPVEVAENYTLGAMYAQEMLLFTGLISAVVSGLHMVSHTRKEEDSGITEQIQSFRIGRQANSLAVLLEVLFVNIILVFYIAGVMVLFDAKSISIEGSLLFASSIGLAGVLGGVIALIMAQIMPTAGGASGGAMAIIGLLYMGRGLTDVANPELSVFNPLGWIYLTYPFTENNWYYLFYLGILSVIGLVIAFILEENRDIGSGYLPQSTGRIEASRFLQSIPGLFFRLNRSMMISWLAALAFMGLAYGSVFSELQVFVGSNELISQMFQQENMSVEASYTGIITLVMVGLATILPIAIVNKLFTEEKSQRLNQLFAFKTSRFEIYWTNIAIAILAGVLGIFLSSAAFGLAGISAMKEASTLTFGDFIVAGFNQLPLVLFFVGLTGLVLGFVPRLGKFLYLYLTYNFFIVYFDGLIEFPEWVMKTSVQGWLPQLPADAFNATIFIGITVISLVMMVAGYIGYNQRDLIEEG